MTSIELKRSLLAATVELLRKWTVAVKVRIQLRREIEEFARLDKFTVQDLGMSRSEFNSYWAESHNLAELTRVRVNPAFFLKAHVAQVSNDFLNKAPICHNAEDYLGHSAGAQKI